MINKRIHGCLQIWNFSSRVQLEDKFYSYARHVLFSAYRTLLRLFVIQLLRQYLAQLQDSFSFDITLVSHALLGFFFIQLLRWYLVLLQDSFSSDYYVSFLCTFRILFHQIVMLLSCPLQGFFFIRLLCQCLVEFQDPFSFDCDVRIVRTIRILLHSVVKLVSRGLLRFFFILLLCQYLTHFYIFSFNCNASFVCTFTILFFSDCFSFHFYVYISRTLRKYFYWIVVAVSLAPFQGSFHWIVTLASRRRLGSFFHLIVTLVP